MPIRARSDNVIRYAGPTRFSDGTILNQAFLTANGGSISFNAFHENKEHRIAAATTRLRASVASGATSFTVPHQDPFWIETSDKLEIQLDSGEWFELSVTGYANGTDESTPATNFGTITATGDAVPSAVTAGALIRMKQKALGGTPNYPVSPVVGARPLQDGDIVHILGESNLVDIEVVSRYAPVTYTEDGETAVDQDPATVMVLVPGTVAADSNVGNLIRVAAIPAAVAMSEYGSDATWTDTDPTSVGGGFEGILNDLSDNIQTGDVIRIQISLTGMDGLTDIVSFLATVTDS